MRALCPGILPRACPAGDDPLRSAHAATRPAFAGFQRGRSSSWPIRVNNERAWFQPRRPTERLEDTDGAAGDRRGERFQARGIPLLADPKRSPFRIYRDTRFSRDKSPYKTHYAATFPWIDGARGGGEAADDSPHGNGGYFNFQPGEMYAGGGMWMPEKPRLEALRRAILDDPDRVRLALEDPAFVAWFGGVRSHEQLKRVPPELPADHPMADMFRWKDLVFGRPLSDDEVCSAELPDRLADGFAAAMPVFRFLATLR
jgi:uncharacterized protein (TIGR02453 family)